MTCLLQVLINNKINRIIIIEITNHALVHCLAMSSTPNKVARLGSRSADERMAAYSLEAMECTSGMPRNEWGRPLKELLDIYDAVAATRSAHMTAYGAAIFMLYDQELRRINTRHRKKDVSAPTFQTRINHLESGPPGCPWSPAISLEASPRLASKLSEEIPGMSTSGV